MRSCVRPRVIGEYTSPNSVDLGHPDVQGLCHLIKFVEGEG